MIVDVPLSWMDPWILLLKTVRANAIRHESIFVQQTSNRLHHLLFYSITYKHYTISTHHSYRG
jgi:hypothetical protein